MKRQTPVSLHTILIAVSSALIISSCGSNDNTEVVELQSRCDSLQTIVTSQDSRMGEYVEFFNNISGCIDSIAEAENILLIDTNPETGRPYSKPAIKARIGQFQDLLARQRDRIAELSMAVARADSSSEMATLRNIIEYLNEQLEIKNTQLEELKEELSKSNTQRVQLHRQVTDLTNNLTALKEQNVQQETAIAVQKEQINQGYVKIGTKKELEKEGFIKTGFLRKSKVNPAGVDKSKMIRVDTKVFTTATLESKNPKILTDTPVGSYTLIREGDSTVLTITDISRFWSLSNILIIQL